PPGEWKILANTIRDCSPYVPVQYKQEQPAALMVFQDGERMRDVKGRWRIPIVFDNLIARGDMPPTIAVFVNSGNPLSGSNNSGSEKSTGEKSKGQKKGNQPSNRGFEYDSL